MDSLTKKGAFAWSASAILAPLVLGQLATSLYIGIWYALTRHQGAPPAEVLMQGIMLGVPLGLWGAVCVFWLAHRRRARFSELFALRTGNLALDLVVGLVLGGIWVACYGFFDVVAFSDMFAFDRAKLFSLPATFSAGFCEEFMYRGFLFLIIMRAGGGAKSQVLWTSVAFGLAHVFWGPWGMLWTTLLGGTFAIARIWRGNVWPAVVAHTVLNLCIEPALINKALSGGFG